MVQASCWKGERQQYRFYLGSAVFPTAISLGLHGGMGRCCTSLAGCTSNTSGDQVREKAETKTCIAKSQGPSLLLKEELKTFQQRKKKSDVLKVFEGHLIDLLRVTVCGKKQPLSLQAYSKPLFQ